METVLEAIGAGLAGALTLYGLGARKVTPWVVVAWLTLSGVVFLLAAWLLRMAREVLAPLVSQ